MHTVSSITQILKNAEHSIEGWRNPNLVHFLPESRDRVQVEYSGSGTREAFPLSASWHRNKKGAIMSLHVCDPLPGCHQKETRCLLVVKRSTRSPSRSLYTQMCCGFSGCTFDFTDLTLAKFEINWEQNPRFRNLHILYIHTLIHTYIYTHTHKHTHAHYITLG